MRVIVCAIALAALSAGSATATGTPDAAGHAKEAVAVEGKAEAARTLYVCDNSAMTRRAFTREFGAIEFVTAEEAAKKGQAWKAPKCITSYEARRLKQLASAK